MKIASARMVGLMLGLGVTFATVTSASAAEQSAGDHKLAVAPAEYLSMQSPIDHASVDDDALKGAVKLYNSKCKKCHGEEGDGKGSATEKMVIKPSSFNTPGYLAGRKDGQLFYVIKMGSEGSEMRGFGEGSEANLKDDEIWSLVALIRKRYTK